MSKQQEIEQAAARWMVEIDGGTLPPQLAEEFKAWIEADPRHKRMLDAITEANEIARIAFRGKKPCQ